VYLAREVAEKRKRNQLRKRRLSKDIRNHKSSIRRVRLLMVLPRKRPPRDPGRRARNVRKGRRRKKRCWETSRGWYGSPRARNRLKQSLLRIGRRRMRRRRLRSY
jgi:hypothetical protein